jgi:hypothetical protein
MVALEEGWCADEQINESEWDSDFVWRMLGKCSTRCHSKMCSEMWFLGMSYLEDLPCMDMVTKLLEHF